MIFDFNKYRVLLCFLIFFLSINNYIFGQIAPKYSNEFLSIGIGGRSLAMGNANTSTVDDITSVYWNPAGLVENGKKIEIGLMHSEYFAGIAKYDFIGIHYNIDLKSSVALSMIRFGVDDIPNTLHLFDNDGIIHWDRISTFSAVDYAFLASYSRKLSIEGFNVGGNVKVIRRNVGKFAGAWGFGFDIGAKYIYKNWKFGVNFKDITSTFNAWKFNHEEFQDIFEQTGNEIPQNGLELTLPRLHLGFSYCFNIKNKVTILPEICLPITTDGKRNALVKTNFISIDPCAGLEIGYVDLVFVRFGVCNFQNVFDIDNEKSISWQPNLGVGIKYK